MNIYNIIRLTLLFATFNYSFCPTASSIDQQHSHEIIIDTNYFTIDETKTLNNELLIHLLDRIAKQTLPIDDRTINAIITSKSAFTDILEEELLYYRYDSLVNNRRIKGVRNKITIDDFINSPADYSAADLGQPENENINPNVVRKRLRELKISDQNKRYLCVRAIGTLPFIHDAFMKYYRNNETAYREYFKYMSSSRDFNLLAWYQFEQKHLSIYRTLARKIHQEVFFNETMKQIDDIEKQTQEASSHRQRKNNILTNLSTCLPCA